MVMRAPAVDERCHCARNCDSTADAENHAPMLSTDEPANTAKARQRPCGSGVSTLSFVTRSGDRKRRA
jgi:hypothetical protein